MQKFVILLTVCFFLFLPVVIFARIGVGVSVGKIKIDEVLKPGAFYDLPLVPVLNTGDEPANYELSIEYHEGQESNPEMGLRPDKKWFIFKPGSFRLKPGEVQNIRITLNLPVKKTEPGHYFAYLEAHPTQKIKSGQTKIGIAAATKLYFTVAPANTWQAILYKMLYFWEKYRTYLFLPANILLGWLR